MVPPALLCRFTQRLRAGLTSDGASALKDIVPTL